ncbi:MAG TPA: hypothetical protein VGY52_13000 [Roseiarcus sp.]|jgi:hypothetical protein|nr:hypothetical protein [Roseiarcus sp.]
MLAREIIHTCSNVHVARAALASIGGELAAQVAKKARETNLTTGALVADLVKDFSRRARDDDWDGVDEAARGADQPILSGLRYILVAKLGMQESRSFFGNGLCPSPWVLGPLAGGACVL